MSRFLRICAFLFVSLLSTNLFAAGYVCSTKTYTSCNKGYYMVTSATNTTYNGTPAVGNTCLACPANAAFCPGGTDAPVYEISATKETLTTSTLGYYSVSAGFCTDAENCKTGGSSVVTAFTSLPTKSGYTFGGYYYATGDTQHVTPNGVIVTNASSLSGPQTWYARWTECPAGYYCDGSTPTAKVSCPSGWQSDAGSTSQYNCYKTFVLNTNGATFAPTAWSTLGVPENPGFAQVTYDTTTSKFQVRVSYSPSGVRFVIPDSRTEPTGYTLSGGLGTASTCTTGPTETNFMTGASWMYNIFSLIQNQTDGSTIYLCRAPMCIPHPVILATTNAQVNAPLYMKVGETYLYTDANCNVRYSASNAATLLNNVNKSINTSQLQIAGFYMGVTPLTTHDRYKAANPIVADYLVRNDFSTIPAVARLYLLNSAGNYAASSSKALTGTAVNSPIYVWLIRKPTSSYTTLTELPDTNGYITGTAGYPSGRFMYTTTCPDGYALTGTSGTATASCSQSYFSIHYAGNGNTGGANPSSPTQCNAGDTTCKAPANTYTKTGHTFAGWACTGGNTSCDGDIISAGAALGNLASAGATIVLAAQWTPNVTGAITLDSKYYATSSTTTGTAVTTNAAPTSVYIKYNTGWYSNSAATTSITKLSTNPAYTGYSFGGFYTGKAGTGTQMVDASGNFTAASKTQYTTAGATATWYAKWTPKQFTASYNCGDGTGTPPSDAPATYNSDFTLDDNTCSRTGYTFNGWSDGTTTREDGETFTWTYTTDKTFTAVWTPNTYTVTYNANGGTGTTASSSHTYNASKALTANGFTNGTKKFLGWSTSSTATTATYTNKQSVSNLTATNGGTVTLYAVWGTCTACANNASVDCTLTAPLGVCTWTTTCKQGYNTITNNGAYNATCPANTINLTWANGGRGTAPTTPASCTYDGTFTMPSAMTATGYTFNKWSVNGKTFAAGATVACTYANLGVYSDTATITGTWNANNYTITLNKNNTGANDTAAGSTTLYTTYNTNVYNDSNRTNAMTTSTNGFTAPKRAFTVTFNANGGTVNTTSATATSTFKGYYSAATDGTQYTSAGTDTQYILAAGLTAGKGYTSNKTWYAQWTAGSVKLPAPTRTGYNFAGWGTTATATSGVTGSYTPTASVTLYAIWTPKQFTITLNKNNTGANDTTTGSTELYTKYDAGAYIDSDRSNLMSTSANPLTVPKRAFTVSFSATGATVASQTATSTFKGYYFTPSGATPTTVVSASGYITTGGTNAAKGYTANQTWTAAWTDGTITLPSATKTGYTVTEWYTDSALTTSAGKPGATYTPTASVTLYGKWTANVTGAITLDSRYYLTSSTPTGISVTTNASPSTVYIKYNTGWYSNSAATTSITKLSTKPAYTGYSFGGFYTGKAGTGTQMVDASGNFTTASKTQYPTAGATATWYAHWIADGETPFVVNHYTQNLGEDTYTLHSTDNKTGTTAASITLASYKKTISGFTYLEGFAGTAATGTTKPSSGAVTTTTILASGTRVINLYYNRAQYSFTVSKNGGTGSLTVGGVTATGTNSVTVTCSYGDSITLPGWSGTKANYIFTGWSSPSPVTCNSSINGTTIAAQWGEATCTINGGGEATVTKAITNNKVLCTCTSKAGSYCTRTTTGNYGVPNVTVTVTKAPNGSYALAGATAATKCATGSYSEKSLGSASCTPCQNGYTTSGAGTGYSATPSTVCTVACTNNANVYEWRTATWSANTVTNACTIDACASTYVRTGEESSGYVCSKCQCNHNNSVKSCTVTGTNDNNQCTYSFVCENGFTDLLFGGTSAGATGVASNVVTCDPKKQTVQLDSKYYKNSTTTITPATVADPSTLYFQFNDGVYSDSYYTNKITALTAVPHMENTCYAFRGFYTGKFGAALKYIDEEGNIVVDLAVPENMETIAGDSTLYAHYEPTHMNLKYDPGAGSMSGLNITERICSYTGAVATGSCALATPDSFNFVAPDGYSFAGWKCTGGNASCDGDILQPGADVIDVLDGDCGAITLTAQWTPNTYSITYNLNGGSYGTSHPTSATYDTQFTVNNPTHAHGTFAGWKITGMDSVTHTYGSSTTTATSINSTTATTFKNLRSTSGTVTFTALWTCENGYTTGDNCSANTINLTWANGGRGTAPTTPASCTYGGTFTMPSAMTATGYTFDKWSVNGKTFAAGATNVACTYANLGVYSGTATITGTWTANTNTAFVVKHYTKNLGATTYTLNGTDNKTGTTAATITLADYKKTITGFTYVEGFAGTSATGTTKPSSGAVTSTTILANGTRVINLYYDRVITTITVSKNSGSGSLTVNGTTATGTTNVSFTCEYGATFTLPAWDGSVNALALTKKVFTGWSKTGTITCGTANQTITAQWATPTCNAGTGVNTTSLKEVTNNAPVCNRSSKCGYYCSATQTGSAGATSVTTTCTETSAGYYAAAGATAQKTADAGYYAAAGACEQTPCGAGKWSAGTTATCSTIDAGCYGTNGTKSCPAQCAKGTYSTGGAASCTNVDANCYADVTGSTTACPKSCAALGGGLYKNSNAGAKSENECYITTTGGYYVKASTDTAETKCENGSYYCPSTKLYWNTTGGRNACPTYADHKPTTFPTGTYDSTITSGSISGSAGQVNITSCRALTWFSNTRGKLYYYATYNATSDKYDNWTTSYGWADAHAGYYLTTKGGCGSYAYYKEALPCPEGSYCPGKARVSCNSSNSATVHTTTFGLNSCAADTTHYTLSAEKSTSINACYLITEPTKYVATAGAGQVTCLAGGACPGDITVYYNESNKGRTECANWTYAGTGAAACTSCPTLTSGWSKNDSTSTGWTTYTQCQQTQKPANCASGAIIQTATSSTAWGASANKTALSANENYYAGTTSCPACSSLGGGLYNTSAAGNTGGTSACKATVSAGSYLKAATDTAFSPCPVGSYCPGVTLSYSSVGGANSCASELGTGYTSDGGTTMTEQKNCYLTVSGGNVRNGTSGTTLTQCAAGTFKATHKAYYGTSYSCENCTGRTKYSAKGASACETVSNGYYTTNCTNGNNCTGQSQCSGSTYCSGGVQNNCPAAENTNWTLGTGTGWTAVTQCFETRNATNISSYCQAGQIKKNATTSKTWPTSATISVAFQAKPGSIVSGQTCSQCTDATYSAGGTATTCTACDSNYTANTDAGKSSATQCQTSCDAGTAVLEQNKACAVVTGNNYKVGTALVNYGSKSPTAADITSGWANNTIYSCPSSYSITGTTAANHDARTDCSITCDKGTQVATANAACTTPNTANWYTASHSVSAGSTSGTNVKSCNTGYSIAASATATNHDGEDDCKISCSAGYFVPDAGQGCKVCTAGKYCNAASGIAQTATTSVTGSVTAGYWNNGCGTNATGSVCTTSYKGGALDDACYGAAGATSSCPNRCEDLTPAVATAAAGGKYSSVTPRNAKTQCRYIAPDKTANGCSTVTANTVSYSGSAWGSGYYTAKADKGYRVSATNTATPACAICACGTYQGTTDSTATACAKTDAGYYAGEGAATQTKTDAGYYAAAGACTQTKIDQGCFGGAGSSTACPNQCPAAESGWQLTSTTGLTQVTECTETTTPAISGSPIATICTAGTLTKKATSTTAWGTATASGLKAKSGRYVNDLTCSACAAGTYQGTNGSTATSCTPASAGYYVASAESATQTACVTGSYTNTTGQSKCVACQSGTTTSGSGKTSCDATCANNNSYDAAWATASWSANSMTDLCVISKCGAGSKYASANGGSCTACGLGTYQSSTSHTNTTCSSAGSGYYVATEGASSQSACTSWRANTNTNGATGSTSTSACVCKSGMYLNSSNTCEACAAGTYKSANSNAACTPASSNYYVDGTGKTSQSACSTLGSFYTKTQSTGSTSDKCYGTTTAGKYIKTANSSTQETCAAGSYCPATTVFYGGYDTTGGRKACPSGYDDGGTGYSQQSQCTIACSAGTRVETANATCTTPSGNWYVGANTVTYGKTTSVNTCAVGTNIFNPASYDVFWGWVNSSKEIRSYNFNAYVYVPVEPNTTYIVSGMGDAKTQNGRGVALFSAKPVHGAYALGTVSAGGKGKGIMVTTTADTKYLGVFVLSDNDGANIDTREAKVAANVVNLQIFKANSGYGIIGNAATDHDASTDCKITCGPGEYIATANAACTNVGAGYYFAGGEFAQGTKNTAGQCTAPLTTIGYGYGANEADDCGRKLHAGDDVIYLRSAVRTTPSLRVKVGEKTFYGALSTSLSNSLKVKKDGTTYSVVNDYQ